MIMSLLKSTKLQNYKKGAIRVSVESTEELDISASFTVEAGVSSEDLTKAVKELAGEEGFQKRLVRANDEGEWFEIGDRSRFPARQCIVLGDDFFIKDNSVYTKVTVKFKPGSKGGMEYTLGYADFAGSVLDSIREFRDRLKNKIVPQKRTRKK